MDNYSEPLGETWKYDPEYHRVSEFLGVNQYDREDGDLQKKVSALRDWTGGKDLTEQMLKLDDLRKKSGHQFMGKPLINALYQQIRLSQDTQQTKVRQAKIVEAQRKPMVKDPQNDIQKQIASSVEKTISGTVKKSIQNQVTGMIRQSVKQSVDQTLKNVATDKKFISDAIQGALKESMK